MVKAHVFPYKNIAVLLEFWLFKKFQEAGKREKLQLHLREYKNSEIQGFPACYQKAQINLVEPKYSHWTSSEQIKKGFYMKTYG